MSMTTEFWTEKGYTNEQAKEIVSAHKSVIDGSYVPKATFEAERATAKGLKGQLADRDKQLKELETFKGTADELSQKVSTLQEENKIAKEEYDKMLQQERKNSFARTALSNQTHDVEDVLAKLDFDNIGLTENGLSADFEKQVTELRKSKPHWFKEADAEQGKKPPNGFVFGSTPPASGDDLGTETKDPAVAYAEKLASARISGTGAASNAAKHYFGESKN